MEIQKNKEIYKLYKNETTANVLEELEKLLCKCKNKGKILWLYKE